MNGNFIFPSAASGKQGWPWDDNQPCLPEIEDVWPKITIIVPNYNYGHFIEETLRSIVLQKYPNLELIVIDGKSSDDSVDIIRKYEKWICYWESEPDRGQAHAINKGLERTTGSIVNWVNSDDVMLPGSLQSLAEAHRDHSDALIAGDVIFNNENGKTSRLHHQNLSFETIADPKMETRWMQPGIFIPTSLLSGKGDLDESLRYQFDRDWMLKLSLNALIISIDQPLLSFRVHSGQRSLENLEDFFREGFKVMEHHVDHLQGVSVKEVRSNYELAIAGLFLGAHSHYAPYWDRAAGIGRLYRAVIHYPGMIADTRFLRLLRRALLPKCLLRSKVGSSNR